MVAADLVEIALLVFLATGPAWENRRRDRIPGVVRGREADYQDSWSWVGRRSVI